MNIVHTKDIPASFFPKLDLVAKELGAKSLDMMSVMYSESGCRADAWNDNPKTLPPEKRWNASGLIQFMPFILPGVGWTHGHAAFRRLTATEQLPFVQRYYMQHRGHLGTIGGLYVATFLPALVKYAGDPNYVLTADPDPRTKGESGERLGWAFEPNAAFDKNGDRAITVGELEDAVRRNCRGPRWQELVARLEGLDETPSDTLVSDEFDLRTTIGLQRALQRLGYDPGPIDGLPGRMTSGAVAEYQADHPPLVVDGIIGPRTRESIELALQTQA